MKWLAAQAEAARRRHACPGFPAPSSSTRATAWSACAPATRAIDKHGKPQAELRAGRRPPRQGHDPGRRRPRQPDQAARLRAEARRRAVSRRSTRSASRSCGRCPRAGWPKAPSSTRWATRSTRSTFGGGFIYGFTENRISLGLVVGLDYHDPFLDPHGLFQKFKEHPLVKSILEGGKLVRYGARTISEGGWYSIPRPYADGVLLVGEAAGFLNAHAPQGHPSRHQDRDARRRDGARGCAWPGDHLGDTAQGFRATRSSASYVKKELWKVRNFHQGFKHGLLAGLVQHRPADVHGRPRPRRSDDTARRATRRSRSSRSTTARDDARLVQRARSPTAS